MQAAEPEPGQALPMDVDVQQPEPSRAPVLVAQVAPPTIVLDVQSAQTRDQTHTASTSATPTLARGAYTQREEILQQQEREGNIQFIYVENDGQPHNMIYLIGLKNIFSKQLPNMPKEYICRLVLDRRHKSVALVKRNGSVVGGITYRAFPEQAFGEIAFCAITASEQVKGYGTRLMNFAKEFAVTRDRLTHFLTYADNNAVGYFSKQGFTKEITLPKDRWQGYIKDYDGGTLMECVMHPKLLYAHFPEMIGTQRTALEAKIRTFSNSHIIHRGLAAFKGAKRQPVPIESIPGVREAGWTAERYVTANRYKVLLRDVPVEATPDTLSKFMQKILQEIDRSEEAWPFREPVSRQDVPDYYDVIKDPIDLTLINQRLKSGGYYLTLDIFIADLRRMFNNCRTYNAADTIYYKIASKLEAFLDQYLNAHIVYDYA